MNVALSAVVVFLVLVPGFAFRSRFRRIERTSLDYAPFGEAVVLGVVFAAVLHAVWLLTCYLLLHRTLDLGVVLRLMGSDPAAQADAVQRVASDQYGILAYFGTILLAPFLIAPALRRLAEHFGWHLPESGFLFKLFGFNAPWYYLLLAEPKKRNLATVVAAVVNFGGKCHIVRGVVADFFVNPNGELDRIVLEFADRRPLEADEVQDDQDPEERYYRIDGDFFVLRYSEAITLNIQYLELEPLPRA
jgi:hypothetical protein